MSSGHPPERHSFEEHRLPSYPEIYYRVFGDSTSDRVPVLCLPGFWRNCRDFEELATHLAAQRLVVTPDMRGRGRSPYMPAVEDYGSDRLIEDVWRLLDHLEIERAVFVGTTLGGWMSLLMAEERPDRVAGIVLNDVGVLHAVHASNRMAGNATMDKLTFEAAVARTKAQNEAHFSGLGESDWERMMLRAYRMTDGGRYVRDFDPSTNIETARFKAAYCDFWERYRQLGSIPVAILRGEHSDYLSDALMREMADVHHGTIAATVPLRGHPPLLDEPAAVSAIEQLLLLADARSAESAVR